MLHSFHCPQKQRIFNGAFSFCHDAKGGNLTLWCFVLKRSAKQTNVGECSVNILESHVQIFRPFWAKKSKLDRRWFQLHLALVVSCNAPDLWQHFLTLSITLPKKQFSFTVYSFPPPTLPLSVYIAQKCLFIYHISTALLSIPAQQFKLVLDSIVWAFKHTMRNVADIGMKEFYASTLQVKVFAWLPFGNQLFWFTETFFTNQVASSKILGAMATKMVTTWRVVHTCTLLLD